MGGLRESVCSVGFVSSSLLLGRLGEWRVGGVKRPRLRFTKEKGAKSRLSAVNCTVTILASKQRMSLRHQLDWN